MMRTKAADEEGFRRFEQFLEEWSRRDFMKRTGGAAALAAVMAGVPELLAACGPGQQGPGPEASPVKGGKIIEGVISDIATVNPLNIGDTASRQVQILLFDGLLSISASGDPIPMLASEVPKPSSDNLTYTFKLRPNLKWSDGTPITADDVVFSYRLMSAPDTKDFLSRHRGDLEPFIQSVEAPDPQTVVFKMKKVFASFIDSHCRYGVIPKQKLGSVPLKALNTHDFFTAPDVASGVMKFLKWDKGQQVVLARNDSYWGGKSNLDQYIYKVVPDAVVLAQQLKTGEIDIGQPDPSQWDNLATAANINRVKFVTDSYTFYMFNLDPAKDPSKIFGDKNVRHALQLALDRKSMAQAVFFGQAVPGDSPWVSVNWAHDPKTDNKYPFDKAKAEQLLDAAGWAKGPDGIRAKGGVKMKFEMNTNVGNKVRENLLVSMQEQWKAIGVDAQPRNIQFAQLVTNIRSIRSFSIILIGIANSDPDPDQSNLWTSSGIGASGLNGMDYMNPQVDQMMEQARSITDRSKRKDLYSKIQEILLEDLPAPILFYPNSLWGINKRVVNWKVGPYNTYQGRPWFKDVFVTDGK